MSVRAIFADKQILFDYTDNYSELCRVGGWDDSDADGCCDVGGYACGCGFSLVSDAGPGMPPQYCFINLMCRRIMCARISSSEDAVQRYVNILTNSGFKAVFVSTKLAANASPCAEHAVNRPKDGVKRPFGAVKKVVARVPKGKNEK